MSALGIYKGKDEKIQEHSSKITVKSKPEEDKDNKDDKEKIKEIKDKVNKDLSVLEKEQSEIRKKCDTIKDGKNIKQFAKL